MFLSFADKGLGKKSKASEVNLDVRYTRGNINNLGFQLKTGLRYTGSIFAQSNTSAGLRTNYVTFQKGNTVYIVPQKQKLVVSESRRGYAGVKLVLSH